MYKKVWILAVLAVVLRPTESFSKVFSNRQRSFDFPDNPQPTPPNNDDTLEGVMEGGLEGRQATTLPPFPILGNTLPPATTLSPTFPTIPASIPATIPSTFPTLPSTIPNLIPISAVAPNIVTAGTTCTCVPIGSCPASVPGNTDGIGLIDLRIVTNVVASPGILPVPSNNTSCGTLLVLCCQPGAYQCGVRYPSVTGSPAPTAGQAAYGSYPWQAVLLAPGDVYLGSGVLINNLNVLTVAHRASQYVNAPNTLKVRMGEWNAAAATELIPAQEFAVGRINIHPNYNPGNLKNDIAVLRLATAVQLGATPTIGTACLPAVSFAGSRCFVSGWGRNDFNTGTFQNIQKVVDVPILQSTACQTSLAATRLGPTFIFDSSSFICAGGEAGKDACTGDGGSPLVCAVGNFWYVAGLVAWGIGCGTTNVPGVYVNLLTYIPWIQTTIVS